MNQNEIRQQFIDFFCNRGHIHVPSDTLVPRGDKTLLFTNAGMNQFKDYFLELRTPPHPRVANSQKCMRVSGKHNDLEDVGRDTYHHTFFEMLGNWSFGDYYKREAIHFAWELLTEVWKLPKEKLWATYFRDDIEARELWLEVTDIGPEQVLAFDEKDNFWEMGDTGPCGPCSEIHIDLGESFCHLNGVEGHVCGVNMDCPRYIELWNLVFIQYNKDAKGKLTPLPRTHVDTGMGFERLVAVLQNKSSNYDTDLFTPLIAEMEAISGKKYGQDQSVDRAFRVVVDHGRALTFLISDGIFPSNEGRGYVLRRILRRAVKHGMSLGLQDPFIHRLVPLIGEVMGQAYPEVLNEADKSIRIIKAEEERFHATLSRGIHVLDKMVQESAVKEKRMLSGADLFVLYDTYGFPPDLTRDLLAEQDIGIDMQGFEEEMARQRAKGRASWSGAADEAAQEWQHQLTSLPTTTFVGYTEEKCRGKILALISQNEVKNEAASGEEVCFVLDRSPFYAESGGQVGDTGIIYTGNAKAVVHDTTKSRTGHFLHWAKVMKGTFTTEQEVDAEIDGVRRGNIKRNHTSTHILQAVLRELLGEHVHQAGSLVAPDHFRFDFTHFERINVNTLLEIEKRVNRLILQNFPVQAEETALDEALNQGAMALFDEKYGDTVRMIRIPSVSLELCGGTHVGRTGEIGLMKIVQEQSVAAGVRRIDAVTGEAYLRWSNAQLEKLKSASIFLKSDLEHVPEKVKQLLDNNRQYEQQLSQLRQVLLNHEMQRLLDQKISIGEVTLVRGKIEHLDAANLRTLADRLKAEIVKGVVILFAENNGKVQLVVSVSQDLTSHLHAGKLAGTLAKLVGGGGGGRPDFAQAGGRNPENIPRAIEEAVSMVRKQLQDKPA